MNAFGQPDATVAGTPSVPHVGPIGWLRAHVFATPVDTALGIALLAFAVYALPAVVRWAIVDSVVVADTPSSCAAASGACWAVVTSHARIILFGLYPYAEQWRGGLALTLVALALTATFVLGARRLSVVVALWVATAAVFVVLQAGGVMGLMAVPTDAWGGLPLSFFVFIISVLLGFPLAIVLALGRGSRLPAFRIACAGAIEVVRALPILTILFCAAIVIPLLLPDWLTPGKIYRVIAAMAFFYACFQAEIVRGGLQGVPVGQIHAALSLGMTPLQARLLVELPQALRFTMPATINQIVVALKDTSMLLVVGIFDFMASANTAISKDEWARYFPELYQFVAVVFLVLTSVLAALERRFVGNPHRV
jgi:general L-amino acid transport system permease protein